MDFLVFKLLLLLLQVVTTEEEIVIFQKCKVHVCILKGFKTAANQSWHLLRVVRESNPGRGNRFGLRGLGSIPGRREVYANFDELQF